MEEEVPEDTGINWDAFQLFPSLINVLNDIRNQTEDVEAMRSTLGKNVSHLLKQIEECKKIVESLPGANYTQEEKTKMFIESKEKLELKCKLIEKYKQFPLFYMESSLVGSLDEVVSASTRFPEKPANPTAPTASAKADDVERMVVESDLQTADGGASLNTCANSDNAHDSSASRTNSASNDVIDVLGGGATAATNAAPVRKKLILKMPTK